MTKQEQIDDMCPDFGQCCDEAGHCFASDGATFIGDHGWQVRTYTKTGASLEDGLAILEWLGY